MKIPRHWVRVSNPDPRGPDAHPVTAWGWSDESRADAERHARQRLAALEERLRRGEQLSSKYAYGRNPLREEIVAEIRAADDDLDAVITRNAYGCLVVNTARVLFVDVDLRPTTVFEKLAALFGRTRDRAGERLAELRRALAAMTGSFRIYRTAGGFRVLATDTTFAPASAQAEALLHAAGADPAFVQLCRLQRSFRARLTPKPWRLRLEAAPAAYPREDPGERAAFAIWVERYDRAAAGAATCRFLESLGPDAVHAAVAPILRLHDDYTRAQSQLPLA